MRKKIFITMLLSVIIMNSLTVGIAMASSIDDNATGGGSSSSLTSGNGTLNWSQNKSGYRFTIIDSAGNVVSLGKNGKPGSVDEFFMNYNDINTPYYYTNAKVQPLSAENSGEFINKRLTIEELNKVAGFSSLPPYPISSNGSGTAKGNGEALKLWLMDGKRWIGEHTTYKKSPTLTPTPKPSTGNSSTKGGSNEATAKVDIDKLKSDIINDAKKLKQQLDGNKNISVKTKLDTIYAWMDKVAKNYTDLYNAKKISKSDYDEIVTVTALDMMNYLQYANFVRKEIINKMNNNSSVEEAIDYNFKLFTRGVEAAGIYPDAKIKRLITYYAEGEIEYYTNLYVGKQLRNELYTYAKKYINSAVSKYGKTLKVSSNSYNDMALVTNLNYTATKAETDSGMIQTLSYTKKTPIYLSSAPAVNDDTDEAAIIKLSTTSNSSSNTENEDKGEIIKLLNAVYNGKPLFELTEQSLSEYAGMSTVDIMVEKGYSLLVEPLTYIQPATWNSSTQSAGVYLKYHIFGTITNYVECLTLLKEKGLWSDMSGGAYSTPTSKLGWSALMVESTWEGDGFAIKAPTKQEGTRRPMDELAAASDLSKGVIEGFGMQLYLTNPTGGEFEDDEITPTPVVTSGDTGIVLNENEITKVSSLLDAYDGNKNRLRILSSISRVNGSESHTVYLNDNHGKDKEGNDIPCPGHTCIVSMNDNKYNHIYCVSKLVDDNNIIAKTKSFAPELVDNSTGVSTVGLSGKNDIMVYPDYDFTLYRSMDVPTLASYKNSSAVKKELGELGIQSSDGGSDYESSRLDSGSQKYSFDVTLSKDKSSDTTTTYSHSLEAISGSQTHTLGEANHNVGVTIKTYTGDTNIGKDISDSIADEFNIGNYTFINPTRYIIEPKDSIIFFPYVSMKYTAGKDTKEAYALSSAMSVISNNDYIEVGYCKTTKNSVNLLLDSNMWNRHLRSLDFMRDNDIKDTHSVLAGGATYTLQQQKNNKTYVGLRIWQTVIPDSEISHVAGSTDYYNSSEAEDRRNTLITDINENLEKYKLTQYVEQGIDTEQKSIISEGTALTAIVAGKSQTVFGNQLNNNKKYYLRSDISAKSTNSNAIFTVGDVDKQLVRTVDYTIKSDKDGNVYLYKTVYNGSKELIGQIGKTETVEKLISQSDEIRELDEKTKLVTNYVSAIDRNQGSDENGDTWYNESFDGVSVILSEYMIETALSDGAGNGTVIRSSAIDTKLCGSIDSKSDILNFSAETAEDKVRSSCFVIYPTAAKANVKGFIGECTWGTDSIPIQLKNIEYLFMSKAFYIPNSTVMDN